MYILEIASGFSWIHVPVGFPTRPTVRINTCTREQPSALLHVIVLLLPISLTHYRHLCSGTTVHFIKFCNCLSAFPKSQPIMAYCLRPLCLGGSRARDGLIMTYHASCPRPRWYIGIAWLTYILISLTPFYWGKFM